MQERTIGSNLLLAFAWGILIAASVLLPGCAASGNGAADWSLLPETDAELAEAVEEDPFPTAAELGIAATDSR